MAEIGPMRLRLYETPRLTVRHWAAGDRDALARLNADPEVMRHFPARLSRAESDAFYARLQAARAQHGYAFPVVELKSTGVMIGFVGLSRATFPAPFTPATEIGWRLFPEYWGQGYASEAGEAALKYGFEQLGLDEIVSFTAIPNTPSQAVMRRIGMTRNADEDFDHPALTAGHPLRRHVLYRAGSRS